MAMEVEKMQDIAFVRVHGETIKVLRRSTKYGISLKCRKNGINGRFLVDESDYLESESGECQLRDLKAGLIIKL